MTSNENIRQTILQEHEIFKQFLNENTFQSFIEPVEGKPYYNQTIKFHTGDIVAVRLDFRGGKMEVFPRVGTLQQHFFIEPIKGAFPNLLKFWESYGKKTGCSIIQFQDIWLRKELETEEMEHYFLESGYRYIGQSDAIFLGDIGLLRKKSSSYVKELKTGTIPKSIYSLDRVIGAFKKLRESVPSLTFFGKRSETKLPYYYLGHHGEVEMKVENEAFHLVDEEIEFNVALDDLFKSENELLPLLEKVEKKQRVKNIFDMPTYHIKNKIRTSEESIRAILDVLKKKHTVREIEDYFAKDYEAYEQTIQVDNYQLFKAMNTYFVLKRYDNAFFKHYETIEEAKMLFTNLVFEKFEEKNKPFF